MSTAEREMAAESWRRAMAPLLERRVGPRKVAIDAEIAPATLWNPVFAGDSSGPAVDKFVRSTSASVPLPASDADIAFAPVTQAVALDRTEGSHLRAPDEHLPAPHRAVRSEAPVRHHAHEGCRARAGETGRRGNRGREVSRATARHSVRREGSARYGGHRDDLRCGAVQEPRPVRRFRGGTAPERSRRRPHRQTESGRARAQRHLVRRPDDEPVAARRRRIGIERRTGRGDGGGARRLLDRQRNGRQHRRPGDALRRDRPASHIRPRPALGRDDALLVARQARPDDAQRRRRDAGAAGDLPVPTLATCRASRVISSSTPRRPRWACASGIFPRG